MPERVFQFGGGIEQRDPALTVMQQLPRHSAVAGIIDRAEGAFANAGAVRSRAPRYKAACEPGLGDVPGQGLMVLTNREVSR